MKINKCPKCGREPTVILLFNRDKNVYCGVEVECYDCGLHSGRCDTEEEAIAKWNELTNNQVTKN